MSLKNKIFLKSFIIISLFAVGLQAFATWVPPTGTPPNGNTEPPINGSSTTQSKLGGIVAFGGLRGDVLVVDKGSTLNGDVTIALNKKLTINGNSYLFPATQGIVGDFLKIDSIASGVATLKWATLGSVSGSGTLNYVPKWTPDGSTLGNSQIYDSGYSVGVGTTTSVNTFAVNQSSGTSSGTANSYQIAIRLGDATDMTLGSNATKAFFQTWNSKPLGINFEGNDVYFGGKVGSPLKVGINTINPGSSLGILGNVAIGSNYATTSAPGSGLIVEGNVGIGDSSPLALLTVGSGDAFQVNNLGDLSRIRSVAYTWPNIQGGVNSYLLNDGNGNLSWVTSNGNLPNGTVNQTLRNNGGGWVADSTLLNTGTNIGVGVTPSYKFHVLGETRLVGSGGGYALTAMLGNVGIGSSAPLELLSVGNNANGNLGVLSLSNAVSGRVIIQPNTSTFTTYTLTLPNSAGTNGQVLTTNGTGTLSWTTPSGGGDNLGNHTATQSLQMSGSTIFGSTAVGGALTLDSTSNGTKGTVFVNNSNFSQTGAYTFSTGTGAVSINGNTTLAAGKTLTLSGSTSGTLTFQPAATTTSYTATWPATVGTNGQVLTTNGTGTLSWATPSGVTAIGTIDTQTKIANGAVISSSSLYMQTADASFPGLVSTGSQTFAGAKTFNSDLTVNTITLGRGSAGVASNTALGYHAIFSAGSGALQNTAVGYEALTLLTGAVSGDNNTAVGYRSLDALNTGFNNTAIGSNAGGAITSGSFNVAVGYVALESNVTGVNNVAIGYDALGSVTASDNTSIGHQSGLNLTTGTGNVFIGSSADVTVGGGAFSNVVVIGKSIQASASNQVRLGGPGITGAFIGTGALSTTASTANLFYDSATGQLARSTSSIRYKKNVSDLEIDTSNIYKLKPVSYTSKSDGLRYFGLIAEDVAKSIPALVEYAPEKNVIVGSTSDLLIPDSVKYPMLSVLILKETQKHEAEINELQKENDELKARIEALEAKIK